MGVNCGKAQGEGGKEGKFGGKKRRKDTPNAQRVKWYESVHVVAYVCERSVSA